VDVRIVAATNKDLRTEIQKGNFREDLYYRLNVIPFVVPPLRERKDDIPVLAEHFLREFSILHGRSLRALDAEAAKMLTSYPWPGNVRELKNLIERVMILTREEEEGTTITAAALLGHLKYEIFTPKTEEAEVSENPTDPQSGKSLRDARQEFEKEFILRSLKENDWNVSKTSQILGIERSYLHRKIKSFGLDPDSEGQKF
jgi:two-component system nitrogen regulation response regulator NtrX